MDELFYILIKLIVGLFGGGDNAAKGPGFPNLPPRPPTPGNLPPRPPQVPQPMPRAPGQGQRQPQGQGFGRPQQAQRRPAPQQGTRRGAPRISAPPLPPPVVVRAPTEAPVTPVPPMTIKRQTSQGVNSDLLRRWLRPQTLRTQFIVTEIFQPPLALREERRNY